MQLAFVLYKYFPYGGMQRDFLAIAKQCQKRGHGIQVFTAHWQGDIPEGFDVHYLPYKGITNHAKQDCFIKHLQDSAAMHSDGIVGFNKMPGLDFYFAADPCYLAKVEQQKPWYYPLLPRYHAMAAAETAVFGPHSHTHAFMIAEVEKQHYQHYYHTPEERLHSLPPGIQRDRQRPNDADLQRAKVRQQLGLGHHEMMLIQIGSGFIIKGLDRSIRALAALPQPLLAQTHLFVVGQDRAKPFAKLAKQLGVQQRVHFLSGRDDVPQLLLAADVLIHPAYRENTGTVLLEALVAGLPVLTTDTCGYSHYIEEAGCGEVIASPFVQSDLNQKLREVLASNKTSTYQENALRYAKNADIYDMHVRAVDIIEQVLLT